MTSVLSPALPPGSSTHYQAHNAENQAASPIPKQDSREYLADMLRELGAIAAWADLDHARKHIEAALREVEEKESDG